MLVCDPPWLYRDARTEKSAGMARSSYACMPLGHLMSMADEVARISHPNAYLFLWSTKPKLDDALRLMHAWRFAYLTTAFVWVKLRPGFPVSPRPCAPGTGFEVSVPGDLHKGLGHYVRSNSELVLMGRRGKTLPVADRTVQELVLAPRRGHSQKPAEVLDRIVRLLGDRPRIELFARGTSVPGWSAWGDEAAPVQ